MVEEVFMKKIILIVMMLLATSSLFAGQYKVVMLVGSAAVQQDGKSDWIPAKVNMVLNSGDRIKLNKGAVAQLVSADDKKLLKLTETSELVVLPDVLQPKTKKVEDKVMLLSGKVWADVQKLKKREGFTVSTPTAVAGVRGTTFVVAREGEQTKLFVIKGNVGFGKDELEKLVPVKGGFLAVLSDDGNFQPPKAVTKEEIRGLMNGIPIVIRGKAEDPTTAQLRAEVEKEKATLAGDKQQISAKKSTDLMAGRTLKDINGNTVRVEQILRRTDNRTLSLINLTKRDKGIDFLEMKTFFDSEIPNNIPQLLFSKKSDGLEVQGFELIMGRINAQGKKDGFLWRESSQGENVSSSIYFYNEATKQYDVMRTVGDFRPVDENTGNELRGTMEMLLKDGTSDAGKITFKLYLINNEGKILGKDLKLNEGTDIFGLIKSLAGQAIINYQDPLTMGRDVEIDIVGTVDILFVLIQSVI
jgi:hypothetical protein